MINDILLYAGAGVIFLWGVAHVAALRGPSNALSRRAARRRSQASPRKDE